ncbi:gliding motility-associated peptidyl-prolyl isomerase GldI [Flavobacterium sp. ANB]|uniref:gliding motility-associated peptidyl-prolyl isomerase GldI n=1 Tax=unclassified Flavobacterium TaxID=196869 RepID=UPI0012B76EF1|nr:MULTISPECIES: gliding motility-associated peptidyl-prolyl isomerase GldI [unclassified Flavobacterium]MBF4516403.1 gliding motility-associated peptidyl-prolyl isomerase GldI [Flavobacterium sp. ANB]MTD69700.1 gliding motility-associated peptidyl-prolyl isomerase GldI [Flavobacterium sp. LC2016-13]
MNYLKLSIYTLLFAFLLVGCKQHEDVRRPISRSSGSFMKKSADRNKKLVASEEDVIKKIIKSNPKVKYYATRKGYWFSYDEQNTADTQTPRKGDIAYFNLEIKNIKGQIIYSESELGPQTYYVDKQDIMMGLRDGIKLMHKNETVNFLFPSHIAYGYHGDNKKIGPNESLICTVTLRNFVPDPAAVKTAATTPASTSTTTVAKTTTGQNPKPAAPKAVTQTKKDTLNP